MKVLKRKSHHKDDLVPLPLFAFADRVRHRALPPIVRKWAARHGIPANRVALIAEHLGIQREP